MSLKSLLEERLKLGIERYGHGIIVEEDTKKYGTKSGTWEEMALEEYLDAIVYCIAAMLKKFPYIEKRMNAYVKDEYDHVYFLSILACDKRLEQFVIIDDCIEKNRHLSVYINLIYSTVDIAQITFNLFQ